METDLQELKETARDFRSEDHVLEGIVEAAGCVVGHVVLEERLRSKGIDIEFWRGRRGC